MVDCDGVRGKDDLTVSKGCDVSVDCSQGPRYTTLFAVQETITHSMSRTTAHQSAHILGNERPQFTFFYIFRCIVVARFQRESQSGSRQRPGSHRRTRHSQSVHDAARTHKTTVITHVSRKDQLLLDIAPSHKRLVFRAENMKTQTLSHTHTHVVVGFHNPHAPRLHRVRGGRSGTNEGSQADEGNNPRRHADIFADCGKVKRGRSVLWERGRRGGQDKPQSTT